MKLQYRLEISVAIEVDDRLEISVAIEVDDHRLGEPPAGYGWTGWCAREHNDAMAVPGLWTEALLRNGDVTELRVLDIAPYEAAACDRRAAS